MADEKTVPGTKTVKATSGSPPAPIPGEKVSVAPRSVSPDTKTEDVDMVVVSKDTRFRVSHTMLGRWPKDTVLKVTDLEGMDITRFINVGALDIME